MVLVVRVYISTAEFNEAGLLSLITAISTAVAFGIKGQTIQSKERTSTGGNLTRLYNYLFVEKLFDSLFRKYCKY